ncbi:MAG: GntR family transcriptional regulator [Tannerellaceae bacterium]|jgi:DNA-binding transcriptional regulator YhcF (GntR family)|nr:GntR family transcriptional regulator [Tannerellaceae bacterium]
MKESHSIFAQIADRISDRILAGEYRPDELVPSVRTLAVEMNVNPTTAMRAIERLQQFGVLYSRRGVGCLVAHDAPALISEMRRHRFASTTLPAVFSEMLRLGISLDALVQAYNEYMSNHSKNAQDETQ